jgi:hypothetical protein
LTFCLQEICFRESRQTQNYVPFINVSHPPHKGPRGYFSRNFKKSLERVNFGVKPKFGTSEASASILPLKWVLYRWSVIKTDHALFPACFGKQTMSAGFDRDKGPLPSSGHITLDPRVRVRVFRVRVRVDCFIPEPVTSALAALFGR